MARLRVKKVDVTVTVVGGTGSAMFECTGNINLISFLTPGGKYDFDIIDQQGFGITGRSNLDGNGTVKEEKICLGWNTFTISNAQTDGIFSVRLNVEIGV